MASHYKGSFALPREIPMRRDRALSERGFLSSVDAKPTGSQNDSKDDDSFSDSTVSYGIM